MAKRGSIYLNLSVLSAAVVCFEIVSTRISSLIFAYNYAFIILSLAILGIGTGGIFAYYRIKEDSISNAPRLFSTIFGLIGLFFLVFVASVAELSITSYFPYFLLLLIPFFLAGIIYAQLFKLYAAYGFRLYAADLTGAAFGSVASIAALDYFGAPNTVLILAIGVFACALSFSYAGMNKKKSITAYAVLLLGIVLLAMNGNSPLLKRLPIGDFPEKDYYHVYQNARSISNIMDSRWSIYGRADLVKYSNQDFVRQMFIDGAAGTQMYKFNGNLKEPGKMLENLLLSQTTSIPFLFLGDRQKSSMLDIGPGGGKGILIGLLSGIKKITGVEINPNFVEMVKQYKRFDGGIYSNFPNVKIMVDEGRSYIRRTNRRYDLIVMSLPSTEKLQNIDNLAMSENYLLTVQAIRDYLKVLTPSGELIFTVHNRLELMRLITTAMAAFRELGVGSRQVLGHLMILEQDYAPTIVIKKTAFSNSYIEHVRKVMKMIPAMFPNVTYLPGDPGGLRNTVINQFLEEVGMNRISVGQYVDESGFNIKPCRDDSPYFYKLRRQLPSAYSRLFVGVLAVALAVLLIPLVQRKKRAKKDRMSGVLLPLIVFASIGLGFMIIEVTLFQKMVLYLGAPTISLSILLSSILVGMGFGSFFGNRIFPGHIGRRLRIISIAIVAGGVLLLAVYQLVLNSFMESSLFVRAILSFLMISPFGFLLGVPFPTGIQLLKQNKVERYVPWMYGVNGTMSVLGSVTAVILSMQVGFTVAFFVGLLFYFVIFICTPLLQGDS